MKRTLNEIVCTLLLLIVIFTCIVFEQHALAISSGESGGLSKEDTLKFEVLGGVQYGSIEGFIQTPFGGLPGTTSRKRPSFEELGINNVLSFNGSVNACWKMHTLTVAAQLNHFSEKSTLHEPLMSQDISFPENTYVASNIRMDWYRLGYLYSFDLSPKNHAGVFFITPGLDVSLLDFFYELKGSENQEAKRSYKKLALRAMCNFDWKIIDGFRLQAKASGSLPLSGIPSIVHFSLEAEKELFSVSGLRGLAYFGIAYEKIKFKDHQDVSNYINAEMWPLGTAGLKVIF